MVLQSHFVAQVRTDMGDTEMIGTAYPIRQGVIITARHLVPEIDKCENTSFIWRNDSTGKIILVSQLEEILYENEVYDLLIANCKTPDDTPSADLTSLSAPHTDEIWESFGYPRSGIDNDEDIRLKTPGKGTFFPAQDDHHLHHLQIGDDTDVDLWKGISGAPVFRVGSNELVAIIIRTPLQDEQGSPVDKNRLYSTSIPYVLGRGEEKFKKAIGLDDLERYNSFISKRHDQIKALIKAFYKDTLYSQLLVKLKLSETVGHEQVSKILLENFQSTSMEVLQVLLVASADTLKANSSNTSLTNVGDLFCLFVSLMAPESMAAREAIIHLNVRTQIATEINTSAKFGTNPVFSFNKKGKLKGKYAIESSIQIPDTGWDETSTAQEYVKIIDVAVNKKKKLQTGNLDDFDRESLNEKIKLRQNPSFNKLHRLECDKNDKEYNSNALSNPNVCMKLKELLPNFPIVHYGTGIADQEAILVAKCEEMFQLLEKYRDTHE